MGTFSQTNIKCKDLNAVISLLKKYLPIGREIWLDDQKVWFYNLPHEENQSEERNLTIILSQNQNKNWIEIEFDFDGNLYFYDEILRRISKGLETVILLGYYQSTSGEARLAKFENGQLELSFYERYFYYNFHDDNLPPIDRIYVADNFGVANSPIESLKKAKLGEDSCLTDYEFICQYYEPEGYKNDLGKNDWTYLHLEQLK